ncbi:1157_t:CDS:1, partial [Acaulospora colombiana]
MDFGSGNVSGNNATVDDFGGVPTGLEYDLDTTIGLYASHVGVKCAFG